MEVSSPLITKLSNKKEKTHTHIELSTPIITRFSDNKARLCCDVLENGQTKTLYYQVDEENKGYLCDERSDAFVIALIPYAMETGKDIICEAPVTETLLHNINEILVPTLAAHDKDLTEIKVIAEVDNTPIGGREVGTGISLGVDSFYTIKKYLNPEYNDFKLTHLLNTNPRGTESDYVLNKLPAHLEEIQKASDELGLPVTFLVSNIKEVFYKKGRFILMQIYINVSSVFALRKMWKSYYYSTAHDLTHFNIVNSSKISNDNYLLLLAFAFTTPDFRVNIGGINTERDEKVSFISDFDVANKFLRVCVKEAKNCNKCFKCKRTLIELDRLGKLDEFSEVFDIDYYIKHRANYFKKLIFYSEEDFYKEIADYFWKNEPKLMAKAKELANKYPEKGALEKVYDEIAKGKEEKRELKNKIKSFKRQIGKKQMIIIKLNKFAKRTIPKPVKEWLKKILPKEILTKVRKRIP